MRTHKDLEVWKRSIEFVSRIYKITEFFPREEMFGLTSQLRRASVSIPSNIAEGSARRGRGEFKQFLYYSLGSATEIETQLLIASNLGYLELEIYNELSIELDIIAKMLQGLIKYAGGAWD